MFVHINTGHFEIIVVQKPKLILFNFFDQNARRFLVLYFIYGWTIKLKSQNFPLELIGNIDTERIISKLLTNTFATFHWRGRFAMEQLFFLRPKTEIILYFSTHENHFRKIQRRRIFHQKDCPFVPQPTMSKKHYYSMFWTTISVLKDLKY
jgi:hypothetical protein